MSIVLDGTSGLTTNSGTLISASTIGVGGATPSTSGAGISFPATQSASTNANTLDDYEEGTWTPSQGGQLTVVGTFSSSGTYTKIGNLVSLQGYVAATTSVAFTAAGAVIAGGIPFNAGTSFTQAGIAKNSGDTTSSAVYVYDTFVDGSGSIAATPRIDFNITYRV